MHIVVTLVLLNNTKTFMKYLQISFYDSEGSFDYSRLLLDRVMTV